MRRVVNLARYRVDVKFSSSLRKKRLGDRELDLLVLCGTQIFDHLSDVIDESEQNVLLDQRIGGQKCR